MLDGKEADANYKEIYEKYELDTLVDICVRYKPQHQQQQWVCRITQPQPLPNRSQARASYSVAHEEV